MPPSCHSTKENPLSNDAHRAIQFEKALGGAHPSPQPSPQGEGASMELRENDLAEKSSFAERKATLIFAHRLTMHRPPVCCGGADGPSGRCQKNPSL